MTVINTNYLALVSQNNLRTSKSALGNAIERLSSGLRINNSKDDAAGMAIANRMTAQIRGMTQAARNANDGISLAQTAEGNLKEINGNLQRIRELAVQAANDTNSDSDRTAINTEIAQRMAEIDRIAKSADFNGTKLLDSKGSAAQIMTRDVSFHVGANTDINQDVISIKEDTLIDATLEGLGLDAAANPADEKSYTIEGKDVKAADGTVLGKVEENFDPAKGGKLLDPNDANKEIGAIDKDGKITDKDGKTIGQIKKSASQAEPTANGIKSDGTVLDKDGKVVGKADADAIAGKGGKIFDAADPNKEVGEITADGKIMQNGATPADPKTEVGVIAGYGKASDASVAGIDAGKTAATARALIERIDAAMDKVDTGRANLGAIQNRFESTINNLNNTINNLSASRSRIEDADYAVEVSNMTRAQILQQAGTSVLAQANQVPQTVLSLLR